MTIATPNYEGRGLINVAAEVEHRMTGTAMAPKLDTDLAEMIPSASTYVLILFDGLGVGQLGHPGAAPLLAANQAAIDAPFPTTTTVSLATVATGTPSTQHGLLAYQLWVPEVGTIVNTIHMASVWGDKLELDYKAFLPAPNLWQRLRSAGVRSATVQPANFDRTPLTRTLYGGAQFLPYHAIEECVQIAVEATTGPPGLIFVYVPHVDFAAHVVGQQSSEYDEAVDAAVSVWSGIASGVGDDVAVIGTADHGHFDVTPDHKVRLTKNQTAGLTVYGDPRALFVKGDGAALASDLPATWVPFEEIAGLWGPGAHTAAFGQRQPDGILFADDEWAIFMPYMNDRLVGHHGGLTEAEVKIPLMVQ
jgi:hypothetical protein